MLLALAFLLVLILPAGDSFAYNFQRSASVLPLSQPPLDCSSSNPANPALCNRPYTGAVCPIDYNSDIAGFDPHERRGTSDHNRRTFGLTKRLVLCVKETILYATYAILVPFSSFLASTISILITLAVVFWGINVALGRRDAVSPRGIFVLAVKIGAVLIFTTNFGASVFDPDNKHGGFFGLMMDALEDLLGILTQYISFSSVLACPNLTNTAIGSDMVWERVDCALESLIGGIFPVEGQKPYYSLTLGIAGFLILCFFSGSIGILIGMLGLYLVLKFLLVVARAVYIFIMSYTAFALMVLISPLFIPLMLFRSTIAYFEKWCRLTISFIMQPIFIFAYLAMMVAAFDSIVFNGPNSLYHAIAGRQIEGKIIGYANPAANPPQNPANYFALGEAIWTGTDGTRPILADSAQGEVAVKLDPEQVKKLFKNPSAVDTGTVGVVGELSTSQADWEREGGVFSSLNPIIAGKKMRNFFKIDIPTKQIDWNTMARWSGTTCPDASPANQESCITTTYLIRIFLAFMMAVIVAYMFVAMLEYLPFIGTGVASDTASFPVFGKKTNIHNMGVPGDGVLSGLKRKIGARFGL